jgi:hypothetical protein
MRNEVFRFAEVETGRPCKATVTAETRGLCIKPEGTGTFDSDCGPIYLEVLDGRPVLYVWANINEEEPVKIDLAAALESNRQPTAV